MSLFSGTLGQATFSGLAGAIATTTSAQADAMHVGMSFSGELEYEIAFVPPPEHIPFRNILTVRQIMTEPVFINGIPYTPDEE